MAKPSLFTHPKFRRLTRRLGVPAPHAVGYLECLWHVGYQIGTDRIGDSIDVEAAAQWPGDAGALCDALTDAGFIDERDGAYFIHDLMEHCPNYVTDRLRKERERRSAGIRPRSSASSTPRPGSYTPDTPGGASTNQTEPTEPTEPEFCPEPPRAASGPQPADAEVLRFPCVGPGSKTWALTAAKVSEYADSFPGLDVLAECRKARQWCIDNAQRRKTASGMGRFLSAWLTKAQNSGRGVPAGAGGNKKYHHGDKPAADQNGVFADTYYPTAEEAEAMMGEHPEA